jgi:hypothetical protein
MNTGGPEGDEQNHTVTLTKGGHFLCFDNVSHSMYNTAPAHSHQCRICWFVAGIHSHCHILDLRNLENIFFFPFFFDRRLNTIQWTRLTTRRPTVPCPITPWKKTEAAITLYDHRLGSLFKGDFLSREQSTCFFLFNGSEFMITARA